MSAVDRTETNPIFNSNKLKFGLFCNNATVPQMSTAPEHYLPTWQDSLGLVQQADRMGLEAIVSYSQWRGSVSGNPEHISHLELEPFTWIGAVAAATSYPAVIGTFHGPLMHPTFVAKAAATIDEISGGRAGLNIVAGSSNLTFGQFGREISDPVERYVHLTEFMELVHTYWEATEEFDFDGKYYQVKAGISRPRPRQRPHPALVNAGVSDVGKQFAGRFADVALTHLKIDDPDSWSGHIGGYRKLAADNDRQIQVWTHGYVVMRDTEAEAQDYLNYYARERADQEWVDAWLSQIAENAPKLRPSQMLHMDRLWAAGGGFGLVGTPDSIAETLVKLSAAGLDGFLVTALEPADMLTGWQRDMLPRLEQAGLRQPFQAKDRPAQ